MRRKPRPHNDLQKVSQRTEQPEPKPFDELLEGAQEAPASEAQASAGEEAARAKPDTDQPAQDAHDAQTKKSDAEQPESNPLQILPGAEAKTPALALSLQTSPMHSATKAARPQADAQELATTSTVAAASSAPAESATDANVEIPAGLELAEAADAPFKLPAEPAAARDASQVAEPMLATQALPERTAPVEAKAPPAPPPPPADTERAGEILRQMRVQLSPELRTATIQLSPPELGRISIRMRVERGELRAHVRAERPETLQALERHVPELKATLESIGIQAREIDLQLGFEQQGARQQPPEPRANGASGAANESESRVREHERRLARTLAARTGGIDTYA